MYYYEDFEQSYRRRRVGEKICETYVPNRT